MNLENEGIFEQNKENIELKVREILKKEVELIVEPELVGVYDNLEFIGMNSIDYAELLVELEIEFGIEFDKETLAKESDITIHGLVECIIAKMC